MSNVLKVGIVGFSKNQFDQVEARRILDLEFSNLYEKHKGRSIEIVSGYTAMGVPRIAYELADKYGFIKVGFSAKQALRTKVGLCKVDKEIIVGEKFGDESVAFVEYINGLIRVGGGPQSRKEVTLFKRNYNHLPLARILKEYEVNWFGSNTADIALSKKQNLFSQGESRQGTRKVFELDSEHRILVYRGIPQFQLSRSEFSLFWNEHPEEFHTIVMHGKIVNTPRWQQAYGRNYEYSGSKNNALPIKERHQKYINWCRSIIDDRINGLLINWYAADQKHYIGRHRDSTKGLHRGSSIVTISHGGDRVFRFRPYRGSGYSDYLIQNGDVIVIPWLTNQTYTHEVPYKREYTEDRISVTLRAFI